MRTRYFCRVQQTGGGYVAGQDICLEEATFKRLQPNLQLYRREVEGEVLDEHGPTAARPPKPPKETEPLDTLTDEEKATNAKAKAGAKKPEPKKGDAKP